MEIEYKSNKLAKNLGTPNDILMNYGTRAKKVNQRLVELKASETLEEMRNLPQANCHELFGNRKGELSVDISGNFRIIFIPDHDPLPKKEDGGLDWKQITRIKILELIDYH